MYLHKSKPIVTPSLGLSPTLSESLQLPQLAVNYRRRRVVRLARAAQHRCWARRRRPCALALSVASHQQRRSPRGAVGSSESSESRAFGRLRRRGRVVRRGAGTTVRPAVRRGHTAPRGRLTVSFASTWPRAREGDGHQTNRGTCRDGIGDAALRDQCNYTNLNLL